MEDFDNLGKNWLCITFKKEFSPFFVAVKRLMREAQELAEPTYDYFAQPLSDNLFEWHFTVRGPAETEFDGGIYHGRIVLPPDYPMKPPNIIVLTVILTKNDTTSCLL